MTAAFNAWVLKLTGTAIVSACAIALCPEGRAKRAVQLACGIASVIALVSIAADFDFTEYSSILARYRERAEEVSQGAAFDAKTMTRFSIEEECAAYILDKAEERGLTGLTVSVTAAWDSEGYWYPVRCSVAGDITEGDRAGLARVIEADLGIPLSAQTWSILNELEA